MKKIALSLSIAVLLLSCGAALAGGDRNPLPGFVVRDSLQITEYDGVSDDLLSAGLNLEGLSVLVAPGYDDANNPTPAELRKNAIYSNYRGIIDPVPGGGMGLLWGPGSRDAPEFDPSVEPGLIPGVEYKAYFRASKAHGNDNNVTMIVQIPRNFDPENPCIVTAPPSGSRGIYGGIAVGEWGLFKGCAAALGGKGTGTGFHLLGEAAEANAVNDIDGVYGAEEEIGRDSQFRVKNKGKLRRFIEAYPNRVAAKHAHSQINPEARWGEFALKAIEFAFWAINDYARSGSTDIYNGKDFDDENHRGHGRHHLFTPKSTLVIASGVSNGAGVSIRSLEEDKKGLIDGMVVSEPSMNPRKADYQIKFGSEMFNPKGRTLNDAITLMGTYASCAVLSESLEGTPFFDCAPRLLSAFPLVENFENRCEALHELGLLEADTLPEQAEESLQILRENGYYQEQDWGIAGHECLNLWRSLQPTYAASYGRFAVYENLCNVSFGSTGADGRPQPVPEVIAKALFAASSGIPATAGINLIADDALNGPILENLAVSPLTGLADLNLQGALCFRFLSTGNTCLLPERPTKKDISNYLRVYFGERKLQTNGNLRRKPAIIIHGREDALVFPNYQSRAYYALNQVIKKGRSNLRYWEVTPAQHFDTFISSLWVFGENFPSVQYVPLHYYLTEGLDMMYDHLKNGTPLPPSQVIRATPRGTDPYTEGNVDILLPQPKLNPGSDAITFARRILHIPK
jgi:hydroxybutyrate-dimer hydrolase